MRRGSSRCGLACSDVPLIVVDTSVALPATLSRSASMKRKLWVLLAYGWLTPTT
jgi:hypothetical protein